MKAEHKFRLTYPSCQTSLQTVRVQPSVLVEPIQRFKTMNDGDETDNENQVKKTATQIEKETRREKSPIYGQWIERVNVKGCNKTILTNHIAIAYEADWPVIFPLVNGHTRLDPIDQPFAEKAITERLEKLEIPCRVRPFIMNTHIVGYRTEDGSGVQKEDAGYGWFEQWHIRACKNEYNANVAILPDPKKRYRYAARLKKRSPSSVE